MNMKQTTAIAFLASLLAAQAVTAATFDEIDTDTDGVLSADELGAAFGEAGSATLDAYDEDRNGFLSYEEAAGGGADGNGQMTFDEIDLDGDGTLGEDEIEHAFSEKAQAALAKFDENADGVVTLDEVRRSDNTVAGRRGGRDHSQAGRRDVATEAARADRGNGRGNSARGNSGRENAGNGGRGNGNGNGNGGQGNGNGGQGNR